MLVKFVHNVRSTVHDGVGLVLGVFTDAIACKTANFVFVNGVCGLDYIDVFFLDGR